MPVSPLDMVAVKVTGLPYVDGVPEVTTVSVGLVALTVKVCALPVTAA
jgi:hypothetical protein